MIVKNEAHTLEQCLASAKPHVDDIVVVDTGSDDETVEIARRFGARVYFFEWVYDFATARNESLKHAKGDWVLQLDADERLNVLGVPDGLRGAVSAPGIDAYIVPIRNHHTEQGKATYCINYNLRLFKRLPGVQYEREVHESVELSLGRIGGITANAGFIIEHEGYNTGPSDLTRKLNRNLEILKKYAEREPRNAFVLYYLGNTYRSLGRNEESLEILERALSGDHLNDSLSAMILNAMNLTHLIQQDYDKTIQLAEKSLKFMAHQNTARYFLGAAYYNKQKYATALPYLYFCYQYSRLPVENKATGISQEYTMDQFELLRTISFCHAHQESYAQAIIFGNRCLEIDKTNYEVNYTIALCYIRTSNYKMAIKHYTNLVDISSNCPKLYFGLSYCYLKIGDIENSIIYLSRIIESTSMEISDSLGLICEMAQEFQVKSHQISELVHKKCDLFLQGNFEQIGKLITVLTRKLDFAGLEAVFEVIQARTAELEAYIEGVSDFFAERDEVGSMASFVERLVQKHPHHPVFLHAYGKICVKKGDICRAIETYSHLRDLLPGNETTARELAGLYLSMGDQARALQILETAGSSGPPSDGMGRTSSCALRDF
jgi:tetratricopeptide (TPR) repeat protein